MARMRDSSARVHSPNPGTEQWHSIYVAEAGCSFGGQNACSHGETIVVGVGVEELDSARIAEPAEHLGGSNAILMLLGEFEKHVWTARVHTPCELLGSRYALNTEVHWFPTRRNR